MMKARVNPADLPPHEPLIQPSWLRVSHWLNACAALIMMFSGWRIYDASPLFDDIVIPSSFTLGGWLGGALQWHFAAMWLLVLNEIFYIALNIATGRFMAKFLPLSRNAVVRDLIAALRGGLSHSDLRQYNAVQKLAYVIVILDLSVLVLSGLAIWKSVQLPILRNCSGDMTQHWPFTFTQWR
jgi:thiosulfate reductase cytochrome b subunit